jgi:spore cortex formation protein SpoVR/YcgB (stage V sporulation)
MYEQGLVSEGFMLEFYESHCSVVNQVNYDHPYYGQIGINVYSLGFNMFRDIERICMEPTEEDKEYFPHWAGNGDWLGTFKHVVKNYRDESFIRQYLSPKLIRDYKFFSVYDNPASPNMYITAIHNKRGYEDIKESLANMFDLSEKLPDIQVNKVNPKTRKLFLKHISNESKILEPKNTKEVLLHLVNIWKFDVQLDSYDSEGKIYNTFDTEKFDR